MVSPGLTETPVNKEEYLSKKFGKAKFEAVHNIVSQKGEDAGINL